MVLQCESSSIREPEEVGGPSMLNWGRLFHCCSLLGPVSSLNKLMKLVKILNRSKPYSCKLAGHRTKNMGALRLDSPIESCEDQVEEHFDKWVQEAEVGVASRVKTRHLANKKRLKKEEHSTAWLLRVMRKVLRTWTRQRSS